MQQHFLIVAACDSVAELVSWLIYEHSNTVKQRMIPGGSNDERLTDIDCTCSKSQYKVASFIPPGPDMRLVLTYIGALSVF